MTPTARGAGEDVGHSAESDALCGAQTYWYDSGVQRARWCDKPATMRTRALDGSVNDCCDEHGALTIEAGATLIIPPAETRAPAAGDA